MKRSERHRLKQNAVAVAVGNLQGQFFERGRGLAIGIAVVLVDLLFFADALLIDEDGAAYRQRVVHLGWSGDDRET